MADRKAEVTREAAISGFNAGRKPEMALLYKALVLLGHLPADAGDEVPLERMKGRREGVEMAREALKSLIEEHKGTLP